MGIDIDIRYEKYNEISEIYEDVWRREGVSSDYELPLCNRSRLSKPSWAFLGGMITTQLNTVQRSNLPPNACDEVLEVFSPQGIVGNPNRFGESWLLVEDLVKFDYDALIPMEVKINGDVQTKVTYREFLGRWYFAELHRIVSKDITRLVYWWE